MNTIASAGSTPLAFKPADSAATAARAAAGFGAASLQEIQKIEQRLQALLADAAEQAHAGKATPPRPEAGKPELRPADLQGLVARATQQQVARAPGQRPPTLTPQAVLLLLSLELGNVLTEESSRGLASQLEMVKARLAARAASAAELSDAIKLAEALIDSASGDVNLAEGELSAAREALKQAQAEVARLEQALADAPPEEQDAIRAQLEAAKAQVAVQQGKVDVAHARLNEALATLNGALADLEAFKSEADKLDPDRSVSARGDQKALTHQAALGLMLSLLQEIIDTANNKKLAEDTKFIREVLKLREAENMRRSEEYQTELDKAERAQKKMGCLGKIIGWVVTVVAVVAAPFTGGASMVLAGIGLSMAILEEAGVDIMGKIMEPIMKLVMALVKEMAGVVGNVLKSFGVSANVVDKIKDALAVIAVAAMIVAVVFISKKAASTMAVQTVMKAVTKAVTEAISKALPKMLKAAASTVKNSMDELGTRISRMASEAVGSTTENMAKRVGYVTTASQGLQLANHGTQAAMQIVINDMLVDAEKLKADLGNGLMDSQIFRDLMQKILDYFTQTTNLVHALFEMTADVQAEQHTTAQFITHRIGKA